MFLYKLIIKNLLLINFSKFFFKTFINIFSIVCTAQCVSFIFLALIINHSFKQNIIDKIISADGYGTVYKNDYSAFTNDEFDIIKDQIQKKYIVNKLHYENLLIKYKGRSEPCIIKTIDYSLPDVLNIDKYLIHGNMVDDGIIVGSNLFDILDLQVGDEVVLVKYDGINSFNFFKININGVFKTHIPFYDNHVVYGDYSNFNKFFNYNSQIQSIVINKNNNVENYSNVNIDSSKYSVEYWSEKHWVFLEWLDTYDAPIKILLFFIFVICITNIFSTIFIDINNRKKEIETLSILGLSLAKIKKIFIIKSLILTLIGILIGGLQAYLLLFLQLKYNIIKMPSSVYYMENLIINYNYIYLIFYSILLLFAVLLLTSIALPSARKFVR